MGGNSIIALARYRNSQFSILNFQLVIVSLEFKVGFRMRADRADLGCLFADRDMPAVRALPYAVAVAGKDQPVSYTHLVMYTSSRRRCSSLPVTPVFRLSLIHI